MGNGSLVAIRRKHDTSCMKTNKNFPVSQMPWPLPEQFFCASCATNDNKDTEPVRVLSARAGCAAVAIPDFAIGSEKDFRATANDSVMTFITGNRPPDTPIMKPYGEAVTPKNIYVCDTDVGLILQMNLASGKFSRSRRTVPAL